MDVKIMPGMLSGTVSAIPSKSMAHRALICAALADKSSHIVCEGTSKDIEATAMCLSSLGTEISRVQDGYIVHPLKRVDSGTIALMHCGESGSTFRFMLPIVGALGQECSFVLEGRLAERPLSPLYEELVRNGCKLSQQGSNPFNIDGKLKSGRYTLDAGVSSQFISGLLLALPLLEGNSEIQLSGNIESFPYIELTLAMQKIFGVEIEFKDMLFSIAGGQTYRSPGTVSIEGDWSNAAFWFCASAISGNAITVTGLDMESKQGDRAVLEILERFGTDLHGIEIDAANIPDLVPILSVVAAAAKGTTVIYNAGRLRDKESDRLAAMVSVLGGLGADVRETKDGLIIRGGVPLTGGQVSSRGDHRIAMAATIAVALCTEPAIIQGAEAVDKSYPGFFDDLHLLGGLMQRI